MLRTIPIIDSQCDRGGTLIINFVCKLIEGVEEVEK